MKAIPYLLSGLAWFFILNALVQINAQISAGAVCSSIILAFLSGAWLIYRSEAREALSKVK